MGQVVKRTLLCLFAFLFLGLLLASLHSSVVLFTPCQHTWPPRHLLFSIKPTPNRICIHLRQLFSSYSQNTMSCTKFTWCALWAFFLLFALQLPAGTCLAASVSAIGTPVVEQEVIRCVVIDLRNSLLSDISSVHNNRELSYGWPESEDVDSLRACSSNRCMSS